MFSWEIHGLKCDDPVDTESIWIAVFRLQLFIKVGFDLIDSVNLGDLGLTILGNLSHGCIPLKNILIASIIWPGFDMGNRDGGQHQPIRPPLD